jgi:N-acetylglucosamine-6-phosphate deacetylase
MKNNNPCIFTGMQILSNDTWLRDHAVIVEEGRIKNIIPRSKLQAGLSAVTYEFPEDHYLIPGLIDLHIHGAAGHDVMDGTVEALTEISQSLAGEGVTGFLATTMTASHERIGSVLKTIAEAMLHQQAAAIIGAHLEGPFISSAKMGAQLGEEICFPDASKVSHWQVLAKGAIKMMTLAPELPDALSLIKKLREMGIVASIGHTNATYAEARNAIEAGCSHATHLFNAMRGIHQREPGAAGALLLADDVNAELIVDGLHLHPAIVELVLRLKGKDKLLLVTDAMRAKCLGDGQYDLGGQMVDVQSNVATLANGTLAGSTLRMPEAIKNMVQFTQCSLADAVSMASYTPAKILGLDKRKGSIAEGKDADLVVMNASFEVRMTMRDGKKVF